VLEVRPIVLFLPPLPVCTLATFAVAAAALWLVLEEKT
jgi:hypothetical protein